MDSRKNDIQQSIKVYCNLIKNKVLETKAFLTAKAITDITESKATRKLYDFYQKHYKEWSFFFYQNHIVSEKKLISFLVQEVIYEPEKKRGRKSEDQIQVENKRILEKRRNLQLGNEDFGELNLELVKAGIKTVQGYVSAICISSF
jgi:hypothetical protein